MPTPWSSRASVLASAVLMSTGPAMAIGASSVAATSAAVSPLISMSLLPFPRAATIAAPGSETTHAAPRARRHNQARMRRIAKGTVPSSYRRPLLLGAFQPCHHVEPQQRPLTVPGLAARALPEVVDAGKAAVRAAVARRARREPAQHRGDVDDGARIERAGIAPDRAHQARDGLVLREAGPHALLERRIAERVGHDRRDRDLIHPVP